MKMYSTKKLAIAITALVLSFSVQAQDLHVSQWDASPVQLNPGLTGQYKGEEFRIVSQFRNQWGSLSSKYVTTSLAFDVPFKERFGLGGYLLNNDAAKIYNEFNLVMGGSYNVIDPSNEKHRLGFGLQAGIIHKSTFPRELVYDAQYDNNGNFDSYLPSGETIEGESRLLPEVNFGLFYQHLDYHHWYRPYAGVSLFHITQPKQGIIIADADRLPIRWNGHAGSKFTFDGFNLDLKFFGQYQKGAWEVLGGLEGVFDLGREDIQGIVGCQYRWQESVIPEIGLRYFNLDLKVSYDINVSGLKAYTQGYGGIEFSLVVMGSTTPGRLIPGIPRH
jgi:type IX secretion system PorP/SprF family membrane protein